MKQGGGRQRRASSKLHDFVPKGSRWKAMTARGLAIEVLEKVASDQLGQV